jgi:hypothetical protein
MCFTVPGSNESGLIEPWHRMVESLPLKTSLYEGAPDHGSDHCILNVTKTIVQWEGKLKIDVTWI